VPVTVPRAPQQDGAVVAVPPLAEVGPLLDANRRRLAAPVRGLPGRDWQALRRAAREAVVAAARDHFRAGGEPLPPDVGTDSLLLAGHQPELFHPGVWVKHFALNGLARRHGATPLNLVVDNDTVKSTALRMPAAPSGTEPFSHLTSVSFDRPGGDAPWEEQPVQDAALFASFAERVMEVMRGWHYEPLLTGFWPEVLRQTRRTSRLGEMFAAARRTWERRWGCHNLEVPLSAVCRTEPFAWFAAHLLTELPRFHAAYNDCVHAHRRAHHIKSRNHPVPDLAADGDWLEAPFWGWHPALARRGRLFARPAGDCIELRCGKEQWPTLPNDPERMVKEWPSLEAEGFKVRTRALTTTLFARMFLADLFIHGIGGGKYDELTDAIIRRFYECEAPGFLILSATRLLPLPSFAVTPDDRRRLARELRDVHWNPQRHVSPGPVTLPEVRKQKQEMIAAEPRDAGGRRAWFAALRAVTEQLRSVTDGQEEAVRRRLAECDRRLESNAVLRRRDYSFCLYPEAVLRPFCTQFL
jgi:hypothetical protein